MAAEIVHRRQDHVVGVGAAALRRRAWTLLAEVAAGVAGDQPRVSHGWPRCFPQPSKLSGIVRGVGDPTKPARCPVLGNRHDPRAARAGSSPGMVCVGQADRPRPQPDCKAGIDVRRRNRLCPPFTFRLLTDQQRSTANTACVEIQAGRHCPGIA